MSLYSPEVDALRCMIALYLHAERILRDLHSADAHFPTDSLQRLTKQLGAKRFAALRRAGEWRGWEEMV